MSRRILGACSLALFLGLCGMAVPAAACQTSVPANGTFNGNWSSGCGSTHRSGSYAWYYTFTLSSPASIQIDLTSSVDTYLYLMSGSGRSGQLLTWDDDGGAGANSRISRTLSAGTYTIEATTFFSGRTGSFAMTLRSTGGGSCITAVTLNATTSGTWTSACTSTHRSGSYARYYAFTVTETVSFRADLSSSSTDAYLYLLSGSGTNGTVLASDDDSGDGNSARITRTLLPGTYTIEATTYSAGRTGSFALGVSTSAAGGGSCIAPLTLNATTSGSWTTACSSVHRSGSYARFYTFSLSASQDIQIDLTSSAADSYVYLLQGTGTTGSIVAQDDDTGGNNNARIRRTLAAGSYTIEATTYFSGRTGSFGLSAGGGQGITVFLVHGLSQSGGALDALGQTLSNSQYGIDLSRFRIDSGFNWGQCANSRSCNANDCEISDGGRALAQYINQKSPGGQFILIGYSLGGLISRDMLINNYEGVVSSRSVLALITLGTPNVGYPYCDLDERARCPVLAQQMASQYRVRQDENIVIVSNYLQGMIEDWEETFLGRPGQWLAAAGTSCSDDRFCEWAAVDRSVDQGCQDNDPTSDGVVCSRSALYLLNRTRLPSSRWSDANYSHTDNNLSWLVMCGGGGLHPLFNPPANGTLVRRIRDLINDLH